MTATEPRQGKEGAESPGPTPQPVLATLGLAALGMTSPPTLFDEAAAVVAGALEADLTAVLKLLPGDTGLKLCAGVGWPVGAVAHAVIGLDRESASGLALALDETIISTDLRQEVRFRAPPLLRQHGVRSVATAVIRGRDHPWGAQVWGTLAAYRRKPSQFNRTELELLETVANTLALALERDEAERDLERRERELARLTEEVTGLVQQRSRLLAETLAAEDRARARIAQALHDDVLQSLLTARQDLSKGIRTGRRELLVEAGDALAAAIGELRRAATGLHPARLERGGLRSALQAVAEYHSRHGGFTTTVEVAPEATGLHEELVLALARELLSNVRRHARARHSTVTVAHVARGLVLEVADDGIGMAAERPTDALDQGHVGLASATLRSEALGGQLKLSSVPGRGTRVRITLPVEAPVGARGMEVHRAARHRDDGG